MSFGKGLLIYVALPLSFVNSALCHGARDYVITAQRSGIIQFRDPVTLDVLSSLDVDLPANSTGLNGVWADPNGRTLYIEGPEHESGGASACCWLYSIDLLNVQAEVAAGIWGSQSRRSLVSAGDSLLHQVFKPAPAASNVEGDRWQMSPDERWWASLRSGPSVDLYDVSHKTVRSLTAAHSDGEWYLSGAWIKDQFYVYTMHDESGWLWRVSPQSDSFGEPVAVPGPIAIQGCEDKEPPLVEMSTVGSRLIVHETFGGKLDQRQHCDAVPGGAWIVDPAALGTVRRLAPQLYFWRLVAGQDGNSLYGVTSDAPLVGAQPMLVLLDANSGKVIKTSSLENDYWWIAVASLRSIPSRRVTVHLLTGVTQ